MTPRRTIVFFPCHSLDDFPTWLGDSEADELLAAWTAAWHPRLIAAAGRMPAWASVEVPPGNDAEVLGIVTASCDDRLVGRLDPASTPGSRWVRRAGDRPATVRQALAALGLSGDPEAAVLPSSPLAPAAVPEAAPADPTKPRPPREAGVDDFYAFGLAYLLSELLARRMRSTTGLGSTAAFTGGPSDEPATGFEERLVAGARAWESRDPTAAAEALAECYAHLEAARARYYPVDVWLSDLVLLADTTLGPRLAAELDLRVPLCLVATGRLIENLARTDPALTARLRQACDAGLISPAGGRYDEEPLDGLFPETIRESFLQGHRAWRLAVGRVPTTFAQFGGGWSAILPQILTHFDYSGVIWNLFDGTPLPDPGLGRIRWEGSGSGCLEGIARPPLDAHRASTVLNLADRIGDALDKEHTAIIQFAHYAGMASPWFDDLRRIGIWTTALGTFVTPDEHFRRTAGSGKLVSWEPDSYPVSRLPADPAAVTDSAAADPIAPRVAAVRSEAQRLVAGRKVLAGLPVTASAAPGPGGKRVIRTASAASAAVAPAVPAAAKKKPSGGLLGGLARGLFGGGSEDRLVLEHDKLRVRVHPQTGGLLSVRRPEDRGNRLSQHLAIRTTRPPPAVGSPWEDPQERAEYGKVTAQSVTRTGERTILSRGHCSDSKGQKLLTFTQRIELLDGLPLARLDIEVAIDASAAIKPNSVAALERYVACRFAWNENDDLDVVRSLHGQSVVSERTLITAPHFLALRPVHAGAAADADVNILTGGLPWHLRASPHILDSLLLAGDASVGKFTLAVGLGLARPWDAALDLIATGNLAALPPAAPPATTADHVRITWQGPVMRGGRPIGVRVGLVESQGKGGDVTVDWGFDVAAARVADALGRPGGSQSVTVAGRSTTTYLRRWEWLQIDLLFPGQDSAGEWPTEETANA